MNMALTQTSSPPLVIPAWLEACRLAQEESSSSPIEPDAHLIYSAFEFAYQLHEGQYRKSGEPYIAHPVAVATLLRDLGGDPAMIAAGFLHDVVEDTEVTPEELESRFGPEVRHLVEAVTKLHKFNFSSKRERQAENFRRMFLAMARDIRVIVVKLADRLHNMRTLQHLPADKQRRISEETREIFAPLANRLGISQFKWELEDLSFKYLEPDDFDRIKELVAERRSDREERIQSAIGRLRDRLEDSRIAVLEVTGRPKHLYGIYLKMQRQHKEFGEIHDKAAVRIIVESTEDCYRALAAVHNTFRPMPGRFKDYIGLPKPNRYQSLHTTVIGSNGQPIEVQIRTLEMHHVAEYGIAAHWKYKETGISQEVDGGEEEKFTWLRQLLEWQKDLKDAQEYIDNLKDNLFEDEVYVFTPDGDVIPLAQGATPVDFAYRIHTEVGNHMKGARVNDRWSGLDVPLNNGDIVQIVTQKNAHPSLDWLNFAVTPTARNRIRQWYKRSHRSENLARGRELLEKALGKSGFDALLVSEPMLEVAHRCNYQKVDDLLAALGYGEVTLNQVVNRLQEAVKATQPAEEPLQTAASLLSERSAISAPNRSSSPSSKSPIIGIEGLLYHIAGCCKPIPGEAIIGIVTRKADRGISIHSQHCPNVRQFDGDRLIPVSWNPQVLATTPMTYAVDIQIETLDRVGVLRDILSRLLDQKINVCNAGVKTQPGKPALISLSLEVSDCEQLERSLQKIRNMSDILSLSRISTVCPRQS
ncbi:MAG: bifunctional (p)ppGpp synthetase/guanosine-3',5'-bis(diphosphate) 3'-pyrophosphohydrolase [Cyanobacteria bacterium P01_H01_bin.15]